ncbi:MAG: Short-chain dehydrogenase/reductase SDR, partial [uncultured Acidimicrobiales bacterium]
GSLAGCPGHRSLEWDRSGHRRPAGDRRLGPDHRRPAAGPARGAGRGAAGRPRREGRRAGRRRHRPGPAGGGRGSAPRRRAGRRPPGQQRRRRRPGLLRRHPPRPPGPPDPAQRRGPRPPHPRRPATHAPPRPRRRAERLVDRRAPADAPLGHLRRHQGLPVQLHPRPPRRGAGQGGVGDEPASRLHPHGVPRRLGPGPLRGAQAVLDDRRRRGPGRAQSSGPGPGPMRARARVPGGHRHLQRHPVVGEPAGPRRRPPV